jgi:hypothetical protein
MAIEEYREVVKELVTNELGIHCKLNIGYPKCKYSSCNECKNIVLYDMLETALEKNRQYKKLIISESQNI